MNIECMYAAMPRRIPECSVLFNNVQQLRLEKLDFRLLARYCRGKGMSEIVKRKLSRFKRRDNGPSMMEGSMIVRLRPATRLTDRQLEQFCQDNSELRIEQTAEGELIIRPPVFSDGGFREAELTADFVFWARTAKDGKIFGPSTGFTLPNGAMRSPDVSWVRQEQLDRLTPEQWASFAPLCPDFVVELRSRSDRLPKLKAKLAEYIANGARLGWLLDPLEKQVFVYRPDAPVERFKNPVTLSGEPVLAGFTLELARVW